MLLKFFQGRAAARVSTQITVTLTNGSFASSLDLLNERFDVLCILELVLGHCCIQVFFTILTALVLAVGLFSVDCIHAEIALFYIHCV